MAAITSGTVAPYTLAKSFVYMKVQMTKTLIDIDDAALARAQRILGTKTKKDTVNRALGDVVALAARRRDLRRLTDNDLVDLADAEIMTAAWQR